MGHKLTMTEEKGGLTDKDWPTVPQRKSFRLPTRSMMNHEVVAKMAYTIMLTPPSSSARFSSPVTIEFLKRMGK
jgi:hypothetical protein